MTKAEEERLYLLTEECAEVIKEAQKILRHSYENYHPDEPNIMNRVCLQREMSDLFFIMKMMMFVGDVESESIIFKEVEERKLENVHCQENKNIAVNCRFYFENLFAGE